MRCGQLTHKTKKCFQSLFELSIADALLQQRRQTVPHPRRGNSEALITKCVVWVRVPDVSYRNLFVTGISYPAF